MYFPESLNLFLLRLSFVGVVLTDRGCPIASACPSRRDSGGARPIESPAPSSKLLSRLRSVRMVLTDSASASSITSATLIPPLNLLSSVTTQ